MRRHLAGLAIGLAMFGIFLLAMLPASLVIPRIIPTHFQQQVKLSDYSGSIWNGTSSHVTAFRFDLGAAHWRVSPLSLLLMRVDAALRLQRTGFQASVNLSADLRNNLFLKNIQGTMLLSELAITDHFLPGIEGVVNINMNTLDFVDQKPANSKGILTVSGLRLAWIPGLDLGDYELIISQDGESVHARITDKRGPLNIDLDLLLTPGTTQYRYALQGFIQPKPDTELLLSSALQWLGTPDNNGRYTVVQSGSIKL